jgi:hypothetical protein
VPLQQPLHYLIMYSIEVVFSVSVFNLGPEALYRIPELLPKLFMLLLFLLRSPLSRPVLLPESDTRFPELLVEVSGV